MDKVIEINGLTKRFKNLTAVNDLSFSVYRGDVFRFLGPNGAGKSTTIRMLMSLIKPTSGSISIFGRNLLEHRNDIMKKIGAIVEKPDLYGYLTAYKNLEIFGKLSQTDTSKKKIMEILELVGLEKRSDSKVKTFSHGMKQRLGIAQPLLHDPELIILDEPTTGLDPQGMKEIRDLIVYLSKEKEKTIMLSSHILYEVELVATRMIIINKGTAVIEGKVGELLNSSHLKVTFEVDNPALAKSVFNSSGIDGVIESVTAERLIFTMERDIIPIYNKLLVESGVLVFSVTPARSLEEYFLKLTEEGQ